MHPERISVRDFLRQIDFKRGTDNILAVCYYAEFVEGRTDFGAADVDALLSAGKVPQPQNLSRDLRSLLDKRCLNQVKGTSGTTIRYTVTNQGADEITNRMEFVGLVIAKPTERAEIIKEVSDSLHALLQKIPHAEERDYIEESISCLSVLNNAMRAAVVLAWEGVIHNLRRKIDQRGPAGYTEFTNYLQAANANAKSVHCLNDFEDVKDVRMLDICKKMDIIKGKSVKAQLDQWLTFRNGCGHPSNVKPGINKVKAYFEDVIQYVFAVA
jgi:hypothetical protein